MKLIAWFSCGITSAVACKMAIEQYGIENVSIFYIEIKSAHQDNIRFISDCEKWYGKEIEKVKSAQFDDQFDVIKKSGYVNGPTGARCTLKLKKEVRKQIEESMQYDGQVFGFEYEKKEINRAIRFSQQYPSSKPVFPLIERKMTKEMCAELMLKNGIKLPVMYQMGYRNNNCIGCVKGGMGYWNKIRIDFPEYFDRMAKLEREVNRSCINGKYLDELLPHEGKGEAPILPDCGTFCEIDFADLIHPITDEVIENPKRIRQLYLFNL